MTITSSIGTNTWLSIEKLNASLASNSSSKPSADAGSVGKGFVTITGSAEASTPDAPNFSDRVSLYPAINWNSIDPAGPMTWTETVPRDQAATGAIYAQTKQGLLSQINKPTGQILSLLV